MKTTTRVLACALAWMLCLCGFASSESATLTADVGDVRCDMSDTLYGVFFEDINHAADGGLYAELLQNRSFEFEDILKPQRFDHYKGWQFNFSSGAKGKIALMEEDGLNANNTHYLRVTVQEGDYRMANEGFGGSTLTGGIPVEAGADYDVSIYLRCQDFDGTVSACLTKRGGEMLSDSITFTPDGTWQKYEGYVTAKSKLDETNAYLTLTFSGKGEIDVDMASLMPKKRFGKEMPGGGLREDLVEALRELHPSFLRFPGGCVAEGSYYHRNFYNWKDTVGPVEQRKENFNTWGYGQSFGLGYYEYFCLAEEIGALPLPVVHAGMLCQARDVRENPLEGEALTAYTQDVLDLIEFARGGTDTVWGGLRAEMGHPEPFDLRYLAIGNENWGAVYFNHYETIAKAVKEAYPDITTIVSAGPVADNADAWRVIRARFADSMVDEHYYMDCAWFPEHTWRYNTYPRETKVFLGEYAAHAPAVSGKRPNNLYSALCEAAYLTGVERNSDVVAMCCYAPLFARDGMQQWTPDLIWFNATDVLLTPNYYIQQMFATTVGKQVVESKCDASKVYQVVTKTEDCLYVKLVNLSGNDCELTMQLGGVPAGEGSYVRLSGDQNAVNTFAKPDSVVPERGTCTMEEGGMNVVLPAMSATIYTLPLK